MSGQWQLSHCPDLDADLQHTHVLGLGLEVCFTRNGHPSANWRMMGNLKVVPLSLLVMNSACEQKITTSDFPIEATGVHIESGSMVLSKIHPFKH